MKVIARKTSDQATTSLTFVDCTGLAFPIQANRDYVFRFYLHHTTGSADMTYFAINGPASPTAFWFGGDQNRLVLNGQAFGAQTAYDTALRASSSTEASSKCTIIEGLIRNGANAGTLQLRFSSETAGAGGSVSILAGSHGELDDVTDLAGLAGTGAAGSSAPSMSKVSTGNGAASAVGALVLGVAVALSGIAATGLVGTVASGGPPTASLSGVAGTGAAGTAAPSSAKGATGNAGALAAGAIAPSVARALTGNAGVGAVGSASPPVSPPTWMWCGAVTSTSAAVALRTAATAGAVVVKAYAPTVRTFLTATEASGQTILSASSTGFTNGREVAIREGHNVNYCAITALGGSTITVTPAINFNATTACEIIELTGASSVTSSSVASGSGTDQRVKVSLTGLTANTDYFYRAVMDGSESAGMTGWFKTSPTEGTPTSFVYVASACSDVNNSTTYQRISDKNPRVFIHMGDMEYIAPASTDAAFRAMYSNNLSSANQGELVRHQAVYYEPDDQDGAANNGYSGSTGVSNQQAMYRENTPTPSDLGSPGNWGSIQIGRVLFVCTDSRTERSVNSATDNSSKIMWSSSQRAWFQARCEYARANRLAIAWVCPNPWVGAASAGADEWTGYTNARTVTADIIVAAGVQKQIFIMSGDMHALATKIPCPDYSTGSAGATFPVIQAASIDKATTGVKGGPYDQTPSEGPGQYGLFTVTDAGASLISVRFQGKSSTDTDLIDVTFQLDVGQPITGNAGAGSAGSVVASRTRAATGNAGTGTVGTLAHGRTIGAIGNAAPGGLGTLSAGGPPTALTGVAATGAPGTVTASAQIKVVQEAAAESASAASVFVDVPMHEGSTAIITAWSDDVGTSFRPSISDDTPLGAIAPSDFSSGTGWFAVFGNRDGYRAGVVRFTATRFQGTGVIGIRVSEVVNVVATETTTSQGKSAPGTGSDGINVALVGPADTSPRLLYGAVLGLGSGTHAPTTGTGFTKSIIGRTSPALTGVPSVDTEAKRITSTSVQGPTWTAIDGSADYFVFTWLGLEGQGFAGLTSVSAASAVGSVTPSRSRAASGNAVTGSAGSTGVARGFAVSGFAAAGAAGAAGATTSAAVAGVNATASPGSVTTTMIAISGVAASCVAGNVGPAATVATSGAAGTVATGSVAPAASPTATGVSSSGGVGFVSAIPVLASASGTGTAGTVAALTTTSVSGNAAATAVGSVSRVTAPSVPGVSGTAAPGSVVPSVAPSLAGVGATGSINNVALSVSTGLTASPGVGAVGSAGANLPGSATMVGVSGLGAAGLVAPDVSRGVTGNGGASAVGSAAAAPLISASGTATSGSTGSVGNGGLSVAPPGVGGTGAAGAASALLTVAVPGVAATTTAGQMSTPGGAILPGVSATGSAGAVAPAVTVAAVGASTVGATGSVVASRAVAPSGASSIGDVGVVGFGGVVVAVAGNASVVVAGGFSTGASKAIAGVAGTTSIGIIVQEGEPILGVTSTGAVGSVGLAVLRVLNGTGATGSAGAVVASDDIAEIVGARIGSMKTRIRR